MKVKRKRKKEFRKEKLTIIFESLEEVQEVSKQIGHASSLLTSKLHRELKEIIDKYDQ